MADLTGPIKYTVFGNRSFRPGQELPKVSTDLESVRASMFEVHFEGLNFLDGDAGTYLTLAAKQVSPIGMSVEPIEVHRMNDKVFYPGKASPEELTITFDNLYIKKINIDLWRWFRNIYDPLTGEITKLAASTAGARRSFKANRVQIVKVDNNRVPHSIVEVYGVFPQSYKLAELNSTTNEFDTIEVNFKYDFMGYFNDSEL